jgi:dihydrodipicolinate synthase/N-acetylneuraminate lyase
MIDLKARLSGIVTVLNTPFTDNDAVDLDALATNVERALNAGVAGFLVPAMASEVGVLTDEERQEILKTVVATVSGTVPVVGGASAEASSERRRWIDRVMDAGSDAALVAIPYRDTETWERDLRDVAQTGAPLVIQDWDAGGYGAPVETIARLFNELPTFQSIKIEVVPAGSKYTQVLYACNHEIHVAGGWAVTQMIEALDRGVDAVMPTGMHEIYTENVRRYRDANRDGAKRLFDTIVPVLAFSNQHLDISICFFKRLLQRQGIYSTTHCRAPAHRFDAFHERIADELIDHVIATIGDLNR